MKAYHKMKIIPLMIALLCMTGLGFAQFQDLPDIVTQVSTAAGNWLKLGVDVRGIGMGGTNIAAGRGVAMIPSNPAGIAFLEKSQIYASKVSHLAGISYSVFAIGQRFGRSDFIGLHLFHLDSGPIKETTLEQSNGTGNMYHVTSIALRVAYARRLTDRLKVGVNINYIHDQIHTSSMQTFAFDIGSNFDTGIYGFVLGMSVTNFGPEVEYHGKGLNQEVNDDLDVSGQLRKVTSSFPLPLAFKLGFANNLIGPNSTFIQDGTHRLTVAIEGVNPMDYIVSGGAGLEYGWKEMFFLRMGSYLGHDTAQLTTGAGMKYRAGMFIVSVDYAFADYGILESTHQISIGMEF